MFPHTHRENKTCQIETCQKNLAFPYLIRLYNYFSSKTAINVGPHLNYRLKVASMYNIVLFDSTKLQLRQI